MEKFLWINSQDASGTLTDRNAREQKTIRSFVQRSHPPYGDSGKFEEPALPVETGLELANDTKSEVVHRGGRLKTTTRSRQAAMQASWRLGRPMPPPRNSTEYARRILPKDSLGHITRSVNNASISTVSYDSRWWSQSEPRVEYTMEEGHMDSDDDIHGEEDALYWQLQGPPQIQSYLGAGRIDPFNTIAGFELPQYGHEVLDYAISSMWPSFIPMESSSQPHPIIGFWLHACRTSPMVFHTFLFGAAENYLMHQGGSENDPDDRSLWRLRFHSLAIKHINDDIADLIQEHKLPSDELLACILTVAVYGAQKKIKPLPDSSSALSKAQTLEVVAHRQHVQAHKDALIYLVNKKGGLTQVKMFGISVLIQATDLLWSTLEQHVPKLAWSQGIPSLPRELYKAPFQNAKHQYLTTNFTHIPNTALTPSYNEVITAIYWLIIALDTAAESNTTEKYLPDLVPFRNWIQHCLLSLPDYNNPTTQTSTSFTELKSSTSSSTSVSKSTANASPCTCTLSIIRTSLLILSTFIIFPMPLSSGINTRLNDTLLARLYCCVGHDSWTASPTTSTEYAKLIVWASTLGAINCGAGTTVVEAEQKARFIGHLAASSGLLGIGRPVDSAHGGSLLKDREDAGQSRQRHEDEEEAGSNGSEAFLQGLRDVVAGFLWWDSALEVQAREIWDHVRTLKR